MYSTRVNQGQLALTVSPSVVISPRDEYFDYFSFESLDDTTLGDMDWNPLLVTESIMPVDTTAVSTHASLSWSSDLFPTGPQMSLDEDTLHVQSVEAAAVTPNTAASSFGQGVGHVDAMLLSDPAALVTSVSEDSKEATPFCDTPGMSSGTDSGNIVATTVDRPRCVCQICGQSYGRPASLTRHMQAKHHSVTYSCSYCHKTYDRYDNMKRHEKTHRKANQDSPSNGRATRLQSPAIRPTGITKSQRGGRVTTGSWEQQGSPQMSPAQAQRAMQLMGELFLIMGGSSLEAQA